MAASQALFRERRLRLLVVSVVGVTAGFSLFVPRRQGPPPLLKPAAVEAAPLPRDAIIASARSVRATHGLRTRKAPLSPGGSVGYRPGGTSPAAATAATPLGSAPQPATLQWNFAKLPLRFEANQGQTDPTVKFLSRGRGYSLFLTSDEAVLSLQRPSALSGRLSAEGNPKLDAGKPAEASRAPSPETTNPSVLRMRLRGANAGARVTGSDPLPTRSNYFLGNDPEKWRTNVPNYAKVKYQGVYPGIDLVYYGTESGVRSQESEEPQTHGELEFDFVVAPGADPGAIRFGIEVENSKLETRNRKLEDRSTQTAEESEAPNRESPNPEPSVTSPEFVRIEADGDLVIATEAGDVRFRRPVIYQPIIPAETAGHSEFRIQNSDLVDGRYILHAVDPKSKIENQQYEVSFELAAYDQTRPLIIDPVLSYASYLGGTGSETGTGIAVDGSGNVYIVGNTSSPDFPGTDGGAPDDIFVAKLNPSAFGFDSLVYAAYFGGSSSDFSRGIAVDSAGRATIVGNTHSTDLPLSANAFQTSCAGCAGASPDVFVTTLDATGSSLVYSTYLGGTGSQIPAAVAVDASGSIYVAGTTGATNFPTSTGAFQTADPNSFLSSGFVAKFDPFGDTGPLSLLYSTYLGGSDGPDRPTGIAVSSTGNAYVTGLTQSTDFPLSSNAYQTNHVGPWDSSFVTVLNATGTGLVYSTYLGGGEPASGYGTRSIGADTLGRAYVGGTTASTSLPTVSPFRSSLQGGIDAFVSVFDPAQVSGPATLIYSTYFGGSGQDQGFGVAADASGLVFLVGSTSSADFPLVNAANPLQAALGGGFIAKFDPSRAGNSSLVYSTYQGYASSSTGATLEAIAVDRAGSAYVAGWGDFFYPVTANAFQATLEGTSDAVLAKVAPRVAIVQNFAAPEITQLQTYLAGMGVSSQVFDQGSVTFAQLQGFDLVIYDDLSFASGGITNSDVAVFKSAFNAGASLYFIGDDLAHAGFINLTSPEQANWVSLTHLNMTASNSGGDGTVTIADTTHPVTNGPFGLVANFPAYIDPDATTGTNTGEVLIATSASEHVIVAYESPILGNRVVTQNVLAYNPSDPAGNIERAKLFKNAVAWLLGTSHTAPTLIGPVPYLSRNDSPFYSTIQGGTTLVEDFEDGLLNTPGVIASAGAPFGPGGITDSVDADDGVIDGSGTGGWSFFSGGGSTGITFTFNATTLGGFPTHAGIAWTDAGVGSSVRFEAFDNVGTSLGVIQTGPLADGTFGGTTAEDRFFGAVHPNGISKIHVSNTSGGIEVDHLQYGPFAAAGPAVQLSTTSLNFGSQEVNTTSDVMQVTLTNSGTETLHFTSFNVQVSTADTTLSPHFQANNDCGLAIEAGALCTINVFFTPTTTGALAAVIKIVSDAPDSPHFISLTGVGGQAALGLSTTSVHFTGNPLNLDCPTKPVTITNTGDVALELASIGATAPFSMTHNCPATLAVSASCVANVKFSPTVVGPAAGTLTVTTIPATTANTVALSGNGTPPCQLIVPRRTVTLLRGAESEDFAVEDAKPSCSPVELNLTCSVDNPAACLLNPAVIPPSGTSTLRVTNLKAVGAESLSVLVKSTSEFRTASELVSVRFADFAFTHAPEVATVAAGGAASYSLAIRPVNGLAGNLALTCSGAPRGATCRVEPASVTLDGASISQVKVRVTTASRATAWPHLLGGFGDGWRRVVLLLLGLLALAVGAGLRAARRLAQGGADCAGRVRQPLRWAALSAALAAMLLWASCGGGGTSMNFTSGGTPAGTYTLTVTGTYSSSTGATPGTLTNGTTLTLKVN
jgi:hypothetical protein